MSDNKDYKKYYEIGKNIGEGGSVFEAIKKDTKEKRAIKIIDKNKIKNTFKNLSLKDPNSEFMKPYIDCFYKEVKNMEITEGKNKNNRNTVKCYEYFDNKDEFAIVMELCDENMLQFISKRKEGFKVKEVRKIMKQLNNTFKIMNANKIVYGNIKLDNILIKYDNKEKTKYYVKLKLNDGSNKMTELNKLFSSNKYNNLFIAPENIKFKGENFNEECDLWSIGIIIYVLSFKKYPYKGVTEEALIKNIEKDGHKNLKKTGDDNLDDLIRRLLVVDPKKRLTWEQYYNHPFFVNNPKSNYELGKRIGENGYATIYEAIEKKNNEKIAIKIFDKNNIRAEFMQINLKYPTEEEMEFYIKSFYNEVNHMKIIEGINKDNKNAVKLYDYINNKDEFIIVMELCDGNLLNYILQNKETLNIEKIKDILKQLNNSLKIMVDNEIVHRDLKLENILIKKENGNDIFKLKLTSDSCLIKDLSFEEINGNQLYIAPEILKKEKYNEKCDLWSLGIIIYVLSFKDYPYRGKNKKEILDIIKNNGQKNFKQTNDSNLDDLIIKLLVEDPKKRISWKEYFNHPFFNGGKKATSIEKDIIVKHEDYLKYYDKKEKLGEGGFANVFRVIKKNTKEERAIKIIDKEKIRSNYMQEHLSPISEEEMKSYIDKLINEIKIMKIIKDNNNENTIQYYECFETTKELSIIMELCNKSLTKAFTDRNEAFNFKEIKELLMQLNNCFRIMHEKRLCHRDLKLDNILVKYDKDNKPIWKITDYGVSKQLASISKNFSTKIGTLHFMAPEILKEEPYKEKCDLWSLGIIIYVLHFKDYPYKGNTEISMINEINELGQKALKSSGNSKYDDLILNLLKVDPNQRIGWQEYFNHPFFNSSPLANNNYITIKLNVEKKNLRTKKIYFLENNREDDTQNKELNEANIELYINNIHINFNKYFEPTEEGEYEIKIIFKNQIKDCSYMFNKCNNIKSIDLSSFDSSNVINMSYMFSECNNLNEIILNNLNTYNVTDMNHMFNKCYELKKIDFPLSFNTQNVDNMSFMFHDCEKLLELNFSDSFIMNNVTTMRGAFGKCFKLKNLDLTNFNTQKVNDMSYMFDQCNNLEKILINPSTFKTNNVTKMGRMFSECSSLKEIDLSSFNVENVRHMSFMFKNCNKLELVDLSRTKNNKEVNMTHMFDSCSNLRKINISLFRVNDTKNIEGMFDNLSKIEKIIVNSNDIQKYKKEFRNIDNHFYIK